MTNAAFQAVVQELEKVLPPRVVSRSLKDGLQSLNRTPEDVTVADLEQVLRGPVLRQLESLLPGPKAQGTISALIEKIQDPDGQLLHQTPAFGQKLRDDLGQLTEALRPFNLYFEWPEVQKVRAQLQLIGDELSAGTDITPLLAAAREQFRLLRQKLEDQLVLQARELAELEEALDRLRSLGGPRVRRLENLISYITKAQDKGTLATAEIEQARLLSVDLRKLLESSVYSPADPAVDPETIDLKATIELLPEEVNARLRRLDLENEAHRLDQLELQHTNLLALRPQLQERLAALRSDIVGGESVSDGITALEVALDEAFAQERSALTRELATMAADQAALGTPVGASQLRQALQVANGILATTLPAAADIRHIRSLFELAREQLDVMKRTMHDGIEMADAREIAALELDGRQNRLLELFQLEEELGRLPHGVMPELDTLKAELEQLKTRAEQGGSMPDLDGMWLRLEDIRSSLAQRLEGIPARTARALTTLARVERLNSEDVALVRRILNHLSSHEERFQNLSLSLRLQLEASLSQAEELLEKLQEEFEATRNIADKLVSANILDELLGSSRSEIPALRAEPEAPTLQMPGRPEQLASGSRELDDLLADLAAERGVEQLLLLREGRPLGGTFSLNAPGLSAALADLERDFLDLGSSLMSGNLELLTLEMPQRVLAAAWPAPGHLLLAVVGIPATLSLVLHRLRSQLGPIRETLNDPRLA